MIVKVQRPLNASDDMPMAMVYNKDRTYTVMPPMEDVKHLFPNGEAKVYCKVKVDDGTIEFGERVEDQNW